MKSFGGAEATPPQAPLTRPSAMTVVEVMFGGGLSDDLALSAGLTGALGGTGENVLSGAGGVRKGALYCHWFR